MGGRRRIDRPKNPIRTYIIHVFILVRAFTDTLHQIFSHASPFAAVPDELKKKVGDSGIGYMSNWLPQQMILNHEVCKINLEMKVTTVFISLRHAVGSCHTVARTLPWSHLQLVFQCKSCRLHNIYVYSCLTISL